MSLGFKTIDPLWWLSSESYLIIIKGSLGLAWEVEYDVTKCGACMLFPSNQPLSYA